MLGCAHLKVVIHHPYTKAASDDIEDEDRVQPNRRAMKWESEVKLHKISCMQRLKD